MGHWRLDHVQVAIPAGSEGLCDGFYVDLLGFSRVPKPPVLEARGGRWYERDAVVVHLGVDPQFRPARKAHLALLVDDYDELLERLRRAGIEVRPDDAMEGTARCYVDDPVGNRMEIIASSR